MAYTKLQTLAPERERSLTGGREATVSVGPDEVLEQLQKRATAENKKVSDLVRELITSGLREQPRTEDAGSEKVIEYLEGFGGVLMAILFESAGSRYFAEMATKYGCDMESLLREGKPLDSETKAALLKQFEAAALKAGHASWNNVLGLDRKAGAQEPI